MTQRRLLAGGNVIAFRLPGAPAPTLPPIYIPGPPDSDGPEADDGDDELSADVLQFRMPAKAAAIPQHEVTRRVRLVLRAAADWGVGDYLVAVGLGGDS